MILDELDHRVKEKQPTRAKHIWELFQDGWKTIQGNCLTKLGKKMPRPAQTKTFICTFVLFHSFDVFSNNL